jgi:hypothetical protein
LFLESAIQTFEALSEEAKGLWLPALKGFSALVGAQLLKTFLGLTLKNPNISIWCFGI